MTEVPEAPATEQPVPTEPVTDEPEAPAEEESGDGNGEEES